MAPYIKKKQLLLRVDKEQLQSKKLRYVLTFEGGKKHSVYTCNSLHSVLLKVG